MHIMLLSGSDVNFDNASVSRKELEKICIGTSSSVGHMARRYSFNCVMFFRASIASFSICSILLDLVLVLLEDKKNVNIYRSYGLTEF